MPSQRRPGLASIHIYVPEELKADFVAAAELHGQDITGAFTAYMRSYIKRAARGQSKEKL